VKEVGGMDRIALVKETLRAIDTKLNKVALKIAKAAKYRTAKTRSVDTRLLEASAKSG